MRIAAFARTSLLALGGVAVGVGAVLKSSISAAEESQKVQAQLVNALEQQSISFKDNQAAIERRTQALSQMSGIDDELVTTTFINFVRRTGDVTKALNLNAIAVDVARGRNISLEASSALVTRASLGMAGSLRRVGIAARDGASATELLNLLQRKYAGSAEAYVKTAAGAQDRFRVALENTQEVIGAAVLPALTRLLNRTTDWLNDAENQRRIQEDVTKTADALGNTLGALASGFGKLQRATAFVHDADPFGGKSLKDMASFGRSTALDDLVAKFNALADAQKRVAAGYTAIEESRTGADVTKAPRVVDALPQVSGAAFVGRPLTAAEILANALALNPDDVAALREQRAQSQRALDYAQAQVEAQVGNTANWAKAIERESGRIRDINEHLATITAENAAKAEAARLAAIEKMIPNSARGGGIAAGAFGRFQSLIAGTIPGVVRGRGKADVSAFLGSSDAQREASLRTQIAEQSVTNEKKLIPLLETEAKLADQQAKLLRRIGASTSEQLAQVLNAAQLRKRIRDIKNADRNAADRFSLQDLFGEAGNQFAAYGSNVAPLTDPLSRQEAGGATVRAAQAGARTMVVTQNFFGERNATQALWEAQNAARATR